MGLVVYDTQSLGAGMGQLRGRGDLISKAAASQENLRMKQDWKHEPGTAASIF